MMDFKNLTKAEKRVAIAKDAIDQLLSENYQCKKGVYLHIKLPDIKHGESLQPYLLNEKQKCEVCAVGALLASTIRLSNGKYFNTDINRDSNIWQMNFTKNSCYVSPVQEESNPLLDYFTIYQLALMEVAFEGELEALSDEVDNPYEKEFGKAKEFYFRYTSTKKRFIAIMQNIIDNKGTFLP